MKPLLLKVARIGNSRGVRIPAATLQRYQVGGELEMEERSDGILLRPVGWARPKLSWEETAIATAAELERWDEWDSTAADGVEDVPWSLPSPRRVAEKPADYDGSRRRRRP